MRITEFLAAEDIFPSMDAQDKKQLFKRIASHASARTGIGERKIYNALVEREEGGGTGLGNGAALPHARISGLARPFGMYLRLAAPIHFDGKDNQKVDVLFALLIPEDSEAEHIKALAAISRLLRSKERYKALRAASTAEELYAIMQKEAPNE